MPDDAQINAAIKELQKALANIQALKPGSDTFQLNYVIGQVSMGIEQALIMLDDSGIDLESKKNAWDPKEPDETWGMDYFDEGPMLLDEKQYLVTELLSGISAQELFEELLESVKEAKAIIDGEKEPSRIFIYDELDVKSIREQFGLSQSKFAALLGISLGGSCVPMRKESLTLTRSAPIRSR